jgi:CTP synthase
LPRCGFDDIDVMLSEYKVDLVILDLSNGIENDTEAGRQIINKIYSHSFLPVIIYSGYSGIFDNPFKDNYFVRSVKKGTNGINDLKKAINDFSPFIKKHLLVSKEINSDISEIYRHTYQKMISNTKLTDVTKKSEIFTRLIKRRLAASIDETSDSKINAWEIYLYPCLGQNYLTGDILRKKSASKKNPLSYRIILSPSCDLQKERKQIQNVKVACFINIKDKFNKNDLKTAKLLRDTSPERYMFFHKLEGEFPHMICDFKEIETISYDKLDEMFERVVSIDSPFRESIVWADITINGRPGLPERDCETWLESIKTECFPITNHN